MTDRNKVFKIERDQRALIVIPQGKDAGFRYSDVHLESNAVVRLLDDPDLTNVVIDLESLEYSGSILIGALMLNTPSSAIPSRAAAIIARAPPSEIPPITTRWHRCPLFRSGVLLHST